MGVGPDDSWETRAETQTEDAGLPAHERDEDDAAEVAAMTDSRLSDPDLPAHEDDALGAEDTGTAEQNP